MVDTTGSVGIYVQEGAWETYTPTKPGEVYHLMFLFPDKVANPDGQVGKKEDDPLFERVGDKQTGSVGIWQTSHH